MFAGHGAGPVVGIGDCYSERALAQPRPDELQCTISVCASPRPKRIGHGVNCGDIFGALTALGPDSGLSLQLIPSGAEILILQGNAG